jgi:RNA polymerase sigma-70 factor (ECF subfamily)
MCFQASRFDTRIGNDGNIVLLKDQDRTQWNKELIGLGQFYLDLSATDVEVSEYHLESALASCHALAKTFESTNWERIIQLYDMLLRMRENPIIQLNRAIAIGYYETPEAGIDALLGLTSLNNNHFYHTALGDFYEMIDKKQEAVRCYEAASELTESKKELQLLFQKMSKLIQ